MNIAKKQYSNFTKYIKSNKNTILLLLALILCSIIIIYLYQYSLNNNKYILNNHIEGFDNNQNNIKLKSILKDIQKEKREKMKNIKKRKNEKQKQDIKRIKKEKFEDKPEKKVTFELNKNKTKLIPPNHKNRKVKSENFTDSNNIRKNKNKLQGNENYERFEDGLDEDGNHYSEQIKNWGYKSFNTTPYKYGTPEYYEYKKKRERDLESFNNTPKPESNHYKLTRTTKNKQSEQNNENINNKNDDEKFFNISAKDIQKKIFSGSSSNSNNNDTDNFQNIMDEIDNVDLDAFSFNSIGNTLGRYSDNIKNRLKTAADSNPYSPLDKTMAQGSVLYDEFKKLFVIKNVF